MPFPRTGEQPEAMVSILVAIIEKTPGGGATMDDLKQAYMTVKDQQPCDKTIFRFIKRINLLFDPLAYGYAGEAEGDEGDGEEPSGESPAIKTERRNGIKYFLFTRDLAAGPRLDPGMALMMAMSLYPQQRTLLPNQFEIMMKMVFEGILQRVAEWARLRQEIEKYVYVSGYSPARPQRNMYLIENLLMALRNKKRVSLVYLRAYDGRTVTHKVEPYGVLCRNNAWYMVGLNCEVGERHLYRIDQIERMDIVESSIYAIPEDFSLRDSYSSGWGVWTEPHPGLPDHVCLRVAPSVASKFRTTLYHESQSVKELVDGGAEVRFDVTGTREMIPWLLSWGETVKVIEPEWLQSSMIEGLKDALALYQGSTGSWLQRGIASPTEA
jgi:hypothetical protein